MRPISPTNHRQSAKPMKSPTRFFNQYLASAIAVFAIGGSMFPITTSQAQTYAFADGFGGYTAATNDATMLPAGALNTNAGFGYYYRYEAKGSFGFTDSNGNIPYQSGTGAIPGGNSGKLSMLWSGLSTQFAVRNLRDGASNPLATNASLASPTLKVDAAWRYAETNARVLVGFLNEANQGLAVSISKSGGVVFYKIDDFGISIDNTDIAPNGWTQIGATQFDSFSWRAFAQNTSKAPQSNQLTFSITGSSLVLQSELGESGGTHTATLDFSSIAGGFSAPGDFTRIILGGRMGNKEQIYFDNLSINGAIVTTPIPEPSTLALFAGGVLLLITIMFRLRS